MRNISAGLELGNIYIYIYYNNYQKKTIFLNQKIDININTNIYWDDRITLRTHYKNYIYNYYRQFCPFFCGI